MTIKRIILTLLTVVVIGRLVLSLGNSFSQPQIQARLELYQTNLVLQVSELQSDDSDALDSEDLAGVRKALLGDDPYFSAQKQYQQVRETAQTRLSEFRAQLQQVSPEATATSGQATNPMAQAPNVSSQQIRQLENSLRELDLKIGLLQAQRGEIEAAFTTWQNLTPSSEEETSPEAIPQTAATLMGLWREPPRVSPNAESQIQENLNGWFRYRALSRLYQSQERPDALQTLQAQEQEGAKQALVKLAVISAVPGLGMLLGAGLLIFLLAQLLIRGKNSVLATNSGVAWETPWDWEITWQVLIVGFFFVSQFVIGGILLPLFFGLSGINPASFGIRLQAFYILVSYLLTAAGGLLVLYLSIRSFLPLPKDWFRFQWLSNWILWGLGGYLVAVPLVIVVSVLNQQIWQGQGGSNPILSVALQAQNWVALAIFFFTASVAAPIFEEIIFRGFLLPSLTRYLPVWGAILASSLVFSIAHLSLSEVLPLATLGIVLGVVYTRSRNLLAPIFVHSLWNSGTLLSLFILGSGAN